MCTYLIFRRRKLNARIAELEDLAEQNRVRANKYEKDKNRLTAELREVTIELETVSQISACIWFNGELISILLWPDLRRY